MNMKAIIPVYLSEEETFWREGEFPGLIRSLVAEVAYAEHIDNVVVVTDVAPLAQALEDVAQVVVAQDVGHTEKHPNCPRGTAAALAVLAADSDPNSPLLTVNFRNPLLTSDIVNKAVEEYLAAGRTVMFSALMVEDHPCQLKSFLKYYDFGLLHILDATDSKSEYVQTKPFALDWSLRTRLGDSNDRLFALTCRETLSPFFAPLPTCALREAQHPVVWSKESDSSARLYLHSHLLPPKEEIEAKGLRLIALALNGGCDGVSMLLYDNKASGRMRIEFSSTATSDQVEILRVLPLQNEAQQVDIDVARHQEFLVSPLTPQCSCLFYWLFQSVTEGSYDVSEPFSRENILWRYDNVAAQVVNKSNGKVISGRQSFPPVFTPDGSLAVLRHNSIENVEFLMRENFHLHTLRPHESIFVRSQNDIVLVRAMRRLANERERTQNTP
jgi:CMP-N-acetylneuraminic acid synthetase